MGELDRYTLDAGEMRYDKEGIWTDHETAIYKIKALREQLQEKDKELANLDLFICSLPGAKTYQERLAEKDAIIGKCEEALMQFKSAGSINVNTLSEALKLIKESKNEE